MGHLWRPISPLTLPKERDGGGWAASGYFNDVQQGASEQGQGTISLHSVWAIAGLITTASHLSGSSVDELPGLSYGFSS